MSSAVESRGASRAEQFLADFEARERRGVFAGPSWLDDLRRAALARFAETGLPTTRDEEWRFTPINALADTAFIEAELLHVRPETVAPLLFGADVAVELVFVNGRFVPALSRTDALPAGVELHPLAARIAGGAADLQGSLGVLSREQASPFTALNTAFIEDGAVLRIRRNAVVEKPVHVLFYSTTAGAPHVTHPRLLVMAEEHSEARLIESYAGPDGQVYFTNAVTEFHVADRAILDHYRVQRESTSAFHVNGQIVRTGRETVFKSLSLVLGGALVRNDINAILAGQGGDTTLNGLYVGGDTQLLDTHTTIDHAEPHNGSHELYKGILGGRARGVFNGKIIVRQDAQKTDAKQTNKALLLSDDAQINTKPQLEIFADDVKCTHGATVGQLDPEMLFYLRARGIGLEQARALLIRGFAGDITSRIAFAPLRERLDQTLLQRIPRDQAAGR